MPTQHGGPRRYRFLIACTTALVLAGPPVLAMQQVETRAELLAARDSDLPGIFVWTATDWQAIRQGLGVPERGRFFHAEALATEPFGSHESLLSSWSWCFDALERGKRSLSYVNRIDCHFQKGAQAQAFAGAWPDRSDTELTLDGRRATIAIESDPDIDPTVPAEPSSPLSSPAWAALDGKKLLEHVIRPEFERGMAEAIRAYEPFLHRWDLAISREPAGALRELLIGERPLLGLAPVDAQLSAQLPAASWLVLRCGLDGPGAWQHYRGIYEALAPSLLEPGALQEEFDIDASLDELVNGQTGGLAIALAAQPERLDPSLSCALTATPTVDRLIGWFCAQFLQRPLPPRPANDVWSVDATIPLPQEAATEADEPLVLLRRSFEELGLLVDTLYLQRDAQRWLLTTDARLAAGTLATGPDLSALDQVAGPATEQLGLLIEPRRWNGAWLRGMAEALFELRGAMLRYRRFLADDHSPFVLVAGQQEERAVIDLHADGLLVELAGLLINLD